MLTKLYIKTIKTNEIYQFVHNKESTYTYMFVLKVFVNFPEMKKGITCFRLLVATASQMDDADIENLTLTYFTQNKLIVKQIIVDLLGVVATHKTYAMLVDHVIMTSDPHPELVRRALTHYIEEDKTYPQVRKILCYSTYMVLGTLIIVNY